jgi:flagellar assembly factor FliW
MPEIATKYFGLIGYTDDAVLDFPQGVPAFEDQKLFVAIDQPSTWPLVFFQSIDRKDVCFVTLPVLTVDREYQVGISPEDLQTLGFSPDRQPTIGTEIGCFVIVSVSENRPPTANLLAPIVVNLQTRITVQAIRLDQIYSHQHPIVIRAEAEEAKCS